MGHNTALSLVTNKKEANRISRYFEERDRESYHKILNEVVENSDKEDESQLSGRFMEWVDKRHKEFSFLLGKGGGYYGVVGCFLRNALDRNRGELTSSVSGGLGFGNYGECSISVTDATLKQEMPKLIPPKGTVRIWKEKDISYVSDSIKKGVDSKKAWERFLAVKISEGNYHEGRSYNSFRSKQYKMKNELKSGGK